MELRGDYWAGLGDLRITGHRVADGQGCVASGDAWELLGRELRGVIAGGVGEDSSGDL